MKFHGNYHQSSPNVTSSIISYDMTFTTASQYMASLWHDEHICRGDGRPKLGDKWLASLARIGLQFDVARFPLADDA